MLRDIIPASQGSNGGIKESYFAPDGSNWYRKYINGWLEQGGTANVTTTQTVTFPVRFRDKNYNITYSVLDNPPPGWTFDVIIRLDAQSARINSYYNVNIVSWKAMGWYK